MMCVFTAVGNLGYLIRIHPLLRRKVGRELDAVSDRCLSRIMLEVRAVQEAQIIGIAQPSHEKSELVLLDRVDLPRVQGYE